jgi:ankyrin repeat protein
MELIDAVMRQDLDAVNHLLLNPRINVNFADEHGQTPLMIAASNGNVNIGQKLIDSGANINQADVDGETPLIIAAANDQKDFVVLLLEQPNINVNAAKLLSYDGMTALVVAVRFVERHHPNAIDIVDILLNSGADPNIPDSKGDAALTHAIVSNNETLFTLLIAHGADVNQKNKLGKPPLMYSVGILSAMKYLLTVPGLDIDATDHLGKTTLMYSAQRKSFGKECVAILLDAGADPLIKS